MGRLLLKGHLSACDYARFALLKLVSATQLPNTFGMLDVPGRAGVCASFHCCPAYRQRGNQAAGGREEDDSRLRLLAVADFLLHRLLQRG